MGNGFDDVWREVGINDFFAAEIAWRRKTNDKLLSKREGKIKAKIIFRLFSFHIFHDDGLKLLALEIFRVETVGHVALGIQQFFRILTRIKNETRHLLCGINRRTITADLEALNR